MNRERYRNKRRGGPNQGNHHLPVGKDTSYMQHSYVHSRKSGYTHNNYSTSSYCDQTRSKRSTGSSWTDESGSGSYRSSDLEHYRSREYRSCFWRLVLNQRLYYIIGLLFNALLMSFYTVMAFTPHVPCFTNTGQNVTQGFEFAFRLGFFAIASDFVNAAFFEFWVRQRNQSEMMNQGYLSQTQQMMETIYAVMEWVFRGLFILVSLLQMLIMCSRTGQYCIEEQGVLREEGHWLRWLIIVQVSKIVFLSAWHILLNRKKQSFFDNQFDTTFFDQTTYLGGQTEKDDQSHYSKSRILKDTSAYTHMSYANTSQAPRRQRRHRDEESEYYEDDEEAPNSYSSNDDGHDEASGNEAGYSDSEHSSLINKYPRQQDEKRRRNRPNQDQDAVSVESSADSLVNRTRVKFASGSKSGHQQQRQLNGLQAKGKKDEIEPKRRQRHQKARVINYQRESANFDIEDMDQEDDDDQSSGGSDQQRKPGSRDNSTPRSYLTTETTTGCSVMARQQAINQRYILADPDKALETTNMNAFQDRSYLNSTLGAPPSAYGQPQMSYLAATKSSGASKRDKESKKKKRRDRQ